MTVHNFSSRAQHINPEPHIEEKTKKIINTLTSEGVYLNSEIKKLIYEQLLQQKNNEHKKVKYLKVFNKWGLKPFLNRNKEITISQTGHLFKQKIPKNIKFIPFRAFLVLFHELDWDRKFFSSQNWITCSVQKTLIANTFKDPLIKNVSDLALQVIGTETSCFLMEEI